MTPIRQQLRNRIRDEKESMLIHAVRGIPNCTPEQREWVLSQLDD